LSGWMQEMASRLGGDMMPIFGRWRGGAFGGFPALIVKNLHASSATSKVRGSFLARPFDLPLGISFSASSLPLCRTS
jgi:hypothetical protein